MTGAEGRAGEADSARAAPVGRVEMDILAIAKPAKRRGTSLGRSGKTAADCQFFGG